MTGASSFLLLSLLAAGSAWAETPRDRAPADDLKAQVDALCASSSTDPLRIQTPSQPTPASRARAAVADDQLISEEAEKKLAFDDKYCAATRRSPRAKEKKACDLTYARIFRGWHDGKLELKEALAKVCDRIGKIPTQCTEQASAQSCQAGIYRGAAADIRSATPILENTVKSLNEMQNSHVELAKSDRDSMRNPSVRPFVATAARVAPPDRARDPVLRACTPSPSPFCEHLGAAADAGFYAGQLQLRLKDKLELAAKLDKTGEIAVRNAKDSSSDVTGGGGNEKMGVGLDDMLKVATLGLTGASLYCAFNKAACGGGDSSQSSPSQQGEVGATAPTPSSPNTSDPNRTETSSLGAVGGGGTSSPGSSGTGAAPQPSTAATSYRSPASGGLGDGALSHFNGDLGNRGASSPAASSGGASGGGGGSLGSGGTLVSGSPEGSAAPGKAGSDGSGSFGGGGGLAGLGAASGAFSLGDKNAPPVDAALKNILNGDTLPGDTALAPADPALAGVNAATEPGLDDAENLFTRVRETHIRCQKRGCVGQEVGEEYMMILFLIFSFFPGAAAQARAPNCEAAGIHDPKLPHQLQSQANLSMYRNLGEEAIRGALGAANGAYQRACAERPGTATNQHDSPTTSSAYNDRIASILDSGISGIREQQQKLKDAMMGLATKDVSGLDYGASSDGRGALSREMDSAFRKKYLADHDPNSLQSIGDQFRQSASTITKVPVPSEPILREQAETFNKMVDAYKEMDNEAGNLEAKKQALNGNTRINNRNADNLSSKSDPSSTSTASGLAGSPQQGGGGSPGGGSPGGGNPGGGQSSPSGISQPAGSSPYAGATTPTPGSANDGPGTADVGSGKNGGSSGKSPGGSNSMDPGGPKADGSPGPRAVSARTASSYAGSTDSESSGPAAQRASTAASSAHGSVGGGGGGASMGPGGLGGTEAKAEGKSDGAGASKGGDSSASFAGGGGAGGGDEVLSPFGKPLSDPKFTLAGSETDASVKKMIGSFDDENGGGEAGRDPASSEVADGIGERNSTDLFDRVHAYHERCQQKGCVMGSARRKGGGA